MLACIVLIGASYLFGSLPSEVALAKTSGLNPSEEKDLHLALWRKAGLAMGSLGLLLSLSKGIIPVLVGFGFGLPVMVVALSGVAAVTGEMWPVFYHFDGEKGNAPGFATVVTLAPVYGAYPVLLFLVPIMTGVAMRFFFAVFSSKESFAERIRFPESTHPIAMVLPVGMIIGFATAPLASWCSGEPSGITVCLAILFGVILVRRLTAGLRADLRGASSVKKVLVNRFLFDRSY
jgi:glycerol-3-phosphate acyltransferase PlsY